MYSIKAWNVYFFLLFEYQTNIPIEIVGDAADADATRQQSQFAIVVIRNVMAHKPMDE